MKLCCLMPSIFLLGGCFGSAAQRNVNFQLRDSTTQRPVVGARVEMSRREAPPLFPIYFAWNDHGLADVGATTGADRSTNFTGPIPEGRYLVTIDAQSYDLAEGYIDVEAPSSSEFWQSARIMRLHPLAPERSLRYRLTSLP
jgi:hypothetical protein